MGFDKKNLEQDLPRVAEIPFDSERKCMTTFHRGRDGKYVSFTKGAIDVLLDKAVDALIDEGLQPFDAGELQKINERMSADGLRVLGIAMRTWDALPDDRSPEHVEAGLTILGFVGMMDPPREEAKEDRGHQAGDDNRRPSPYRNDHC
jgi:Ca2+-transporting ATPase